MSKYSAPVEARRYQPGIVALSAVGSTSAAGPCACVPVLPCACARAPVRAATSYGCSQLRRRLLKTLRYFHLKGSQARFHSYPGSCTCSPGVRTARISVKWPLVIF